MKKLKDVKKPFFAKLLEAQKMENAQNVKGGVGYSMKFPSDLDEAVTMKYPSDGDDDIGI